MHILSSILKKLKAYLKDWNRNLFGNLTKNILIAEQILADAKKIFDEDPTFHRQNLHKLKVTYLAHLKK